MTFQKIFHFNTSTNHQLENFLCVTENSHQKGFHLAQEGRFIVVKPSLVLYNFVHNTVRAHGHENHVFK